MLKQQSLQAELVQIQENWPKNTLFWIKELYHIYKNKYIETIALKDFNVQIKSGEFLGILGPSGSGKSTFMKILAGLILPTTGRVYFKPDPNKSEILNLARFNLSERTKFRRENIGYIFQEFKLFEYLTVEENIEIPYIIREINPDEFREKITQIMEACGIEHRRSYKIEQLSGGEKQRVQVATALISEPKIILADEPTGNLDTENSKNIFKLLKTISTEFNTSILSVSHDLKIHDYCDRTLKIVDGRIEKKSKLDE